MIISCTLTIVWYEPAAARITTTPSTEEPNVSAKEPILEERDPQANLHHTVKDWIQTIAEQHKLIPWQAAEFTIEPLGPGTHGWLVHVLDNQSPVGYLIITALKDGGYRLAEYGVGERPIFYLETLRTSLIQSGMIESVMSIEQLSQMLELPAQSAGPSEKPDDSVKEQQLVIERHYLYPFAAYWKVRDKEQKMTAYFDAITGEQYPLTKDPSSKPSEEHPIEYQPTLLAELRDRMQLPRFDPYEDLGWIVEQPIQIKAVSDVLDPLKEKERLTLTVELYDGTVLLPYPILGFAQWERSEVYLLVYSEGLRYVPLIDAMRYGRIYTDRDAEEDA